MKKILNKKFITIAIVSLVFFTAIIYMLLNGVDLKNLLSDVNSASNYKTADWSDAKKIDAGYSHSTIFLSKDTRFSVYAFGQKYSLDNTKDYDMSKIDADDGLPYYEQIVKIPTPLKNDTTYDTVGANIKIYWKRYNGIYFPKVYIEYPDKKKGLDLETFTFPGFGFFIENAGTDNNGERFDAYLKVGYVNFFKRSKIDYKSWVAILPYYCIDDINATTYPNTCTQQKIQYGEPLNFEMAVSGGASNTELTYYKKGTFEYIRTENSNFNHNVNKSTAAIDKIGGLFSDIDIYNGSTLKEGEVNGHEAVDFRGLESATIYYDTEGELPISGNDNKEENRPKSRPYIGAKLSYSNGILYISQKPFNVQNLRKSTSAYALETSGASSYYFDYSAVSLVHIYFSYLSPFKYKLEAPKKKTSELEVTDNTSYNYLISQYIPNNSTNKLQKFIQSTNNTSSFYDSITMSDTFDDNLTFNLSDISIKKEDNIDVTECFSLSKSGNTVTAVINKTASSSCSSGLTTQVADFYNHTYTMIVPVTTKTGIDKNIIKNTSKTVGVNSDNIEEELTSNTTETKVYYNVIENYKDMDDNVISNSVTNRVYREENFTSNKIDITGYTYNHVISDYDSSDNTITSGTITKNVNITYYYDKLAKITSNYYVCNNHSDLNLCNKSENKIIDSVTETKKFGDSYNIDNIRNTQETKNETTFLKYDNVGVVTTPSISPIGTITSSTVDNNNNITINFYYRKKSKIIINYYKEGTTEKLADTTTLNQTYDDKYDVTSYKDNKSISMDYRYVSYTSTPEKALSGIVSQDTITVNYYYALKEATINIKYLDELTNENILNEENINTKYGVLYNTLNLDSYKKEIPGYDYSKTETTPRDITGKVNQDTTTIIHYYKKKASITINYMDKYTNAKIDGINSDVINNHYGDSYNTENNRVEKEKNTIFNDYDYANEYVITPENTSLNGTISTDKIVVNYYYNKKSNITIKYYDIETNKEITKENVDSKVHYGDIYNVEAKKIKTEKEEIFKNYNFESYDSNSKQKDDLKQIKIDNENVTVDLYYRLKTSTITIKYLEETTNKELAETYTKSMKYTEVYNATEIRDKAGVPKNYNLVRHESSTGVLSGTISEPSILIIFYYEKKDPKLETSVSKTGTKEITRKNAEIGYKLNYKAVIKDYIGNAKVTYIDKLPYEIDEEKSDISGGKYNKETKTIVWEETYDKINMGKEIPFTKEIKVVYTGIEDTDRIMTNEIPFTKEIKVVYTGIEDTDRIMTNEIETTIKLDNKESTVTSDYDTDIKIPGEIVIHYYDKETKEKLAKDTEKTDLIGNQYVSEEKEFEGYKLVSKPESKVHIYKEKKQEFSYEYEKIKFKITTKVEGEGGTIEGDEIVKYGEDSSKDKIKIKAKEGYEINKITINGESYEMTDRNEIIMPYFKEVKEDKEIIVSFVKKIENPKTLDNIMSYIGYAVLSIIGLIISGIVLIKNKTQEKI